MPFTILEAIDSTNLHLVSFHSTCSSHIPAAVVFIRANIKGCMSVKSPAWQLLGAVGGRASVPADADQIDSMHPEWDLSLGRRDA